MIIIKLIGVIVLAVIAYVEGEARGRTRGIRIGRKQQRWPYETEIHDDGLGNIVVKRCH